MSAYQIKITVPVEIDLLVHTDEGDDDVLGDLSVFEAQAALRNRVKLMSVNEVEAAVLSAIEADDYAVTDLAEAERADQTVDDWKDGAA